MAFVLSAVAIGGRPGEMQGWAHLYGLRCPRMGTIQPFGRAKACAAATVQCRSDYGQLHAEINLTTGLNRGSRKIFPFLLVAFSWREGVACNLPLRPRCGAWRT
jgi:hypothetical protein